jgi:release factor glutamine methyltransferase
VTPALAALARDAAGRLRERQSEGQDAALDAEVLARHALGWDRAQWIAGARDAAPEGFASRFDAFITRRAQGEPIAYITGVREFWGLELEVTPDVLIPRPETEILVEHALGLAASRHLDFVADVGTGSGAVAIALAHAMPRLRVVATDISEAALDVARRNAARHGVADRIEFRLANVLDGTGKVDLVVSNPPYIADGDASVMRDVRAFEPHTALFGGPDGLDVIRALLADVKRREPVPPLLFEFGGDEEGIRAAVAGSGLRLLDVITDLAGIPRVARVEA